MYAFPCYDDLGWGWGSIIRPTIYFMDTTRPLIPKYASLR